MQKINIANHFISKRSPVFIIAEAGVNHNGSLDMALQLVNAAADAGADAVKFQTFKAEEVVTAAGKIADYQKKNLGIAQSQLDMLKKLELPEKYYQAIIARCKKRNIIFLSTPHGGFASVDFLQRLDVAAFKLGSGDLTNLPLLAYAARFKKPMILGTGMATLSEVKKAVRCIKKTGNNQLVILHATTSYPCSERDVNLRAMQSLMKTADVLVGYSDHTLGVHVPIMAVTLGACVIEKHLTLNTTLPGPDHSASLQADEFKNMVQAIRQVPIILGSTVKEPTKSEKITLKQARKSLVSVTAIQAGETFTSENLGIKRPGTGLAPNYYFKVLGKKAKRTVQPGVLISTKDYGR